MINSNLKKMHTMKKIISILLTVISINTFGQIQTIGILSGVNQTNITSKSFENSNFKPGFAGGFSYEFLFNNNYIVGADLLYSQQGFIDEDPTEKYNLKYYFDYLSVPLKIGYGFTEIGKLKSSIKIGVSPSFLLNAKSTILIFDSLGSITGTDKIDVTKSVSKFDLSVLMELGLNYPLENGFELFSSLTGRKSLTTLSCADYFEDLKMKNYGFSLMVGLKYRIDNHKK